MTQFTDAGITATVTAQVTEGETAMSESDFASEGAPAEAVAPDAPAADAADPAAPADEADVAASDADEADAPEADEDEIFEAGEDFGTDVSQVGGVGHFTETEGLGFGPGIDAEEEEEGEEEV